MTKKDEITSQTILCVYELVQKRPGPDELLFAGGYLDSFDIARGGNANEFNEVLSFVRAQIPSGASGNLKGRAIALRNPINIWENTVETRYRNALAEEN